MMIVVEVSKFSASLCFSETSTKVMPEFINLGFFVHTCTKFFFKYSD